MDGVLGRNNTWIYSPGFAVQHARELGIWPCLVEAMLSVDTTTSSAERTPSFLHPNVATGTLMWGLSSFMGHRCGHHSLHQERWQLDALTCSRQQGNRLCDWAAG